MARFFFKFIICVLFAGGAALTALALRSGDPFYTVFEWMSPARFHQYDTLIIKAANKHQLDPMLVKALVWRESRFDPKKFGGAGERGLMQVSETAAKEWAKEERVANFQVEELFDPEKNLAAGAWYLQRALQHWQIEPDPLPFALAEYNAGASRAKRWAGGEAVVMSGDAFREKIDFPGTRGYVDKILDRYRFYKERGRM